MDFSLFGIVGVGAISVICYLIGFGVKKASKYVAALDDFIPVICGLCGAVLGIIGYINQMPDFPAQDPITAIAVGIVSGLAATGLNEAIKQIAKKKQ